MVTITHKPKKIEPMTIEDIEEHQWYLDGQGELCCKFGSGILDFGSDGRVIYQQELSYDKVTALVDVEIIVRPA